MPAACDLMSSGMRQDENCDENHNEKSKYKLKI